MILSVVIPYKRYINLIDLMSKSTINIPDSTRYILVCTLDNIRIAFPASSVERTIRMVAITPLPKAPFGSISNPIGMMLAEHQNEGERFEEISKLSNNYTLPDGGCTTYDVTLKQLKDFDNDLHRHIHLENNILFPKAIALEKSYL